MKNSQDFPKRHPSGLWVLFTTEMWERFAFYTMRAILVLYLVDVSTSEKTPGFGWSEAEAYALYGWYTGLVYLSPLLGGWIADRFLGQRACVTFGAILMTLGEFCLAATEFVRLGDGSKITMEIDPTALITFYIGLGLMIFGNGFFKPCISVMVGQLYVQGDRRRDDAFTIFYMGINIGAFLSPLVGGTMAEKFGYHFGFMIAGLGMICGLISFTMFGKRHLKGIGIAPVKHDPNAERTQEEQVVHEKALHEQNRPLVREDWDRIFVIAVLSIFVIAFWITFEQAGSSLNIFAKINTDRTVSESVAAVTPGFIVGSFITQDNGTQAFPATWYQSVNALGIVIFAPIFTIIWAFLARRGIEPSTPTKFALGLLLVSISFLVMIPGAVEAKMTGGKAAPYWLVFCYLFATWGELCLSPVGLSMVTKLAPVRLASFFMGVWFMASCVAYILAGYMASYFGSGDGISFFLGEKSGLADFFLLMAVIPMVIGFIALALAPKLKQMMHGTV
ncbi:MAG: peptide MFS transporter [Planctomycetaceae bacterium]|jgi:POT family proton-dependent oligopeptide transporter|nr:peptide MFS transporter [Planctomycetaceae bacterium]